MELEEIARRMRECQKWLGESLFLKVYMEASRKYRDNFELILAELEKADPPKIEKIDILSFREKLHSYHGHIDGKTFINAFVDARHKYGDDLELILQEMEKAKQEYEKKINKAANLKYKD